MKSEELHQEMADFRNQLTDSITARIVSGDGRSINTSAPEMILGMDFFNLDFIKKTVVLMGTMSGYIGPQYQESRYHNKQ